MAFDREIAAMTVLMEARGEGPAGMAAVAWVLWNRLATGRFGVTLAEVCLRAYQFSGWNTSDPNRPAVARMDDVSPEVKAALDAVDGAGAGDDPTGGALFYFADSIAAPSWSKAMVQTAQIGRHRFFRPDSPP